MISWIIIIFALLMITGLMRSLVHTLLHHYGEFAKLFNIKNYQWWNPSVSWENKYELDEDGEIIYKDGKAVKNKKILQFSDAFHFFNMIELGALYLAYSCLITMIAQMYFHFEGWQLVLTFIGSFTVITLWSNILWFNLPYDKIWR